MYKSFSIILCCFKALAAGSVARLHFAVALSMSRSCDCALSYFPGSCPDFRNAKTEIASKQ